MIYHIQYFTKDSKPANQVEWDGEKADLLKAAQDGLVEHKADFAIVFDEAGRNLGTVGDYSTNRPWPET
ncbi:MAG TPA: hypothetical protein VFI23_19630 [Rhizomicrobium sp.]|nr:hypothetical protein [Rhizomicrobium sp.]